MVEGQAVRRRDVLLEDVARAGDRQELEDPAAVVVEQHDRQRQAEAARGEQAADVVRERDVADQRDDRPARHRGGAEGAGDRAVDPVRPAVAEHARRVVAHGGERLDVAHRHRRGDEQRRVARQLGGQRAGHARFGERVAVAVQPGVDRGGGGGVGGAPGREPVGVGGRRVGGRSGQRRRRLGGEHDLQRGGRVLPGAMRVEAELRDVLAQAVQPGAQRLGGRQVAAAHDEIGPPGVRELRAGAGARRSARSPRRRAARRSADRPAAASRAARRRPRPPPVPARRGRRRRSAGARRARRRQARGPPRRGPRRASSAAPRGARRCGPAAGRRPARPAPAAARAARSSDAPAPAAPPAPSRRPGRRARASSARARARRRGCRPRRTTSPRSRRA